ncbi:hypothetical protein KAI87_03355 [Myxococcota bacterium]|nr:hypothetical protein [Myxococcota bacterium]
MKKIQFISYFFVLIVAFTIGIVGTLSVAKVVMSSSNEQPGQLIKPTPLPTLAPAPAPVPTIEC